MCKLQDIQASFSIRKLFFCHTRGFSITFIHVRSLNHKIPIEWGRFIGIVREDGIFIDCVLECTYFEDLIELYLPRNLITRPYIGKFENLMNTHDTQLLLKLSKFCKVVLKAFQEISLGIFNS